MDEKINILIDTILTISVDGFVDLVAIHLSKIENFIPHLKMKDQIFSL